MLRIPQGPVSLYGHDGRRKYLTPSERARFIAAAERHERPEVASLALTLALTGCRISEALALQVQNIERTEAFVSIRSLKKRGQFVIREVPVPDTLLLRLETTHHLRCRHAEARLWSWSRGRAWWLIAELMRKAGIPPGAHATAKGLRHGFAIHALRSGVPVNLVRRWLGHASLATTQIYLEAIGDEEREFAARMWNDAAPPDAP